MSRRPDPHLEPLTVRCDESAVTDAWHGARIGHRTRLRQDELRRSSASLDEIGPAGIPRLTAVLLGIVVLVTLIEFQMFGTSPTTRELAEHGGMSAYAFSQGDWWAVVTSNLYHVGVTHLALNLFAIALMSRWVELIAGRWMTLGVVTAAAIGASIGAVVLNPLGVSVGASGIAFGLLTAAFVLDPRARTTMGATARGLLVLNIIGTFAIPGISIGGHFGGLVGGGAAALIAWSRVRSTDETTTDAIRDLGHVRTAPAIIVAASCAAVLAFCALWQVVDGASAQDSGQQLANQLVRLERG